MLDLLEPRPLGGSRELEVPLARGRPDLTNAVVGPRDPDDLARRDRLSFARSRESPSPDHDGLRISCGPDGFRGWVDAELRFRELVPDGAADTASVDARMRANSLDAGGAEDLVIGGPPKNLVGQQVEVLVDAEAALLEQLVERDSIGAVRLPGQKVLLHRRGETPGILTVLR